MQSLRLSAQDAEDSLRMHGTVINLLTWVVLLSLPSLIYWLKNLRCVIYGSIACVVRALSIEPEQIPDCNGL